MDLQTLITRLSKLDPSLKVDGFKHPHSYRGNYADLAFEKAKNTTIGQMLKLAKEMLNETLPGYKGGEYKMHKYVTVYLANYGECGEELTEAWLENIVEIPRLKKEIKSLKARLEKAESTIRYNS